jgi:1-acyl-sn-glycerol-3-phosphate acyltransferase
MLTLDMMRSIELAPRPLGQRLFARGFVGPSLRLRHVDVEIEGMRKIPDRGRVFIAMNHTDRYQNFPFQYRLLVERDMYAATWAKGKYYHRPLHKNFLLATSNIPTPSKGYVITVDSTNVLGQPLDASLYRLIRDAVDAGDYGPAAHARLLDAARDAGQQPDLQRLFDQPRDMLGVPFDPAKSPYLEALADCFGQLIEAFVDLNIQAFDRGLKVVVYPEGTRSKHLAEGHPGLAQMALRTGATIVPVGCSGTDRLYPGHNPVPQTGKCVYRVGEPLTPDGELAELQIDESFRPFTRDSHRFDEQFEAVTRLVMSSIDGLLDPEYRAEAGPPTGKHDADRFVY